MRLRISKYYQSWKDLPNNKVTIVPKNIKTYLTHLPVKLLIRLLINDIKFILGNNTLNIIISFLSEDIIYMFLVIFNITRKIIYPSHVLCTDNYNCPFNKCKKDLKRM